MAPSTKDTDNALDSLNLSPNISDSAIDMASRSDNQYDVQMTEDVEMGKYNGEEQENNNDEEQTGPPARPPPALVRPTQFMAGPGVAATWHDPRLPLVQQAPQPPRPSITQPAILSSGTVTGGLGPAASTFDPTQLRSYAYARPLIVANLSDPGRGRGRGSSLGQGGAGPSTPAQLPTQPPSQYQPSATALPPWIHPNSAAARAYRLLVGEVNQIGNIPVPPRPQNLSPADRPPRAADPALRLGGMAPPEQVFIPPVPMSDEECAAYFPLHATRMRLRYRYILHDRPPTWIADQMNFPRGYTTRNGGTCARPNTLIKSRTHAHNAATPAQRAPVTTMRPDGFQMARRGANNTRDYRLGDLATGLNTAPAIQGPFTHAVRWARSRDDTTTMLSEVDDNWLMQHGISLHITANAELTAPFGNPTVTGGNEGDDDVKEEETEDAEGEPDPEYEG